MAQQFPQQFGPYTLHQLIARGGMAEIYRATMGGIGSFEKVVAIKKILPHLTENEEFITMLIDEAQILVGLNHANIAQVYDLGKIEDSYYIAMEYVHGLDIAAVIKDLDKRDEYIPYAHTAYIVACLCMGLHIAHHAKDKDGHPLNIVHRDISPHNVLISFAGDVKIIDFGVAKARSKNTHTKAGVIKGKLLYMAPEQAMAKDIDGRADLFAAGLVMYKMLTRELPFTGDNEFQIYNNILNKEIVPPKALNPEVPEELNQICMTLLQREPERRYQDGYSAKKELDRALHNVAPGYTPSRLSRFIEDNFSHIVKERQKAAQKAAKKAKQQDQSPPPTPSPSPSRARNPAPPAVPAQRNSGREDVDNGATVEQAAFVPDAQGAGTGERVRTHGNAPSSAAQRAQNPGAFSTPVPGTRQDSGRNLPPEVATPANGFQNQQSHQPTTGAHPQQAAGASASASFGVFQPTPAPSKAQESEKSGGIPPIAIAVIVMAIVMTGLLAYTLIFMEDETPQQTLPDYPEAESRAAAVTPEAAAATPEEDAPAAPAEPEDTADSSLSLVSITTLPSGAAVFYGPDKLGETPLEVKLPAEQFPMTLTVKKRGYLEQSFDLSADAPEKDLVLEEGEAEEPAPSPEKEDGEPGATAPSDKDTNTAAPKPTPKPRPAPKNRPKPEKAKPTPKAAPDKKDKDDGFMDIDLDAPSKKKEDTPKKTEPSPADKGDDSDTKKEQVPLLDDW